MAGISYVIYVWHRLMRAIREERVVGFIANPLLWFTVFALMYLIVGPLLSQQSQLMFGLYATESARVLAGTLAIYTFVVLFLGYFLLQDRRLAVCELDLGALGTILLFASMLAAAMIWVAVISGGPTLLSLRDNRVAAHDFYREFFLGKYKIAMMYQVVTMGLICAALKVKSDAQFYLILFISCAPAILVDIFQGGRGLAISSLILLGSTYSIRRGVVPWKAGLIVVLGFNLHIMLLRFNPEQMQSLDFLYRFLSETFLTHFAFEHIVEREMVTGIWDLVAVFISRALPFGVGLAAAGNVGQYGGEIQNNLGLGFGLAGNICAEAYFFGGLAFCLFSPLLIVGIYSWLYRSHFLLTLPGISFVIFMNMSAQNIMRTNFYGIFAGMISVFIGYLLIINLLAWGKQILVDLDMRDREADVSP